VNEQDVTFDSGGSILAGTYTEAERPVAADVVNLVTAWVIRLWGTP
jgi:hypothetical protein